MGIFYKRVQRGRPGYPDSPKRWYVSIKSTGMMKVEELARLMAEGTTLNPKEAELALFQFKKIVIQTLMEGKTVKLPGLGTFQLTAKSRGVEKKEDVHPKLVEKIKINFEASKDFKKQISKASFTPADSLLSKPKKKKPENGE